MGRGASRGLRALAAIACVTVGACGPGGQSRRPEVASDPAAGSSETPPRNTTPPPVEPPKPIVCGPTAGEARWVLEGESVEATVRCGTGYTASDLALSVEELPPGATFDAQAATLRWTTAKGQAATWNLTLVERQSGERGTLKIGVIPSWTGQASFADPAKYTEEYGLPVLHLFFDEEEGLGGGVYHPVELIYRGRRLAAEAKYRGATSRSFPKTSMTVKFPDDQLFSEPEYDFNDRKRLVLISTFNDNSYIRSRLAFELWNRMSPDHIKIQTFSVVVYRNGRYYGLFTAADHVDKRLLTRHGLSKDSDLYKAVDANANFSRHLDDGSVNPNPAASWEKKEGTPDYGDSGWFDRMEQLIAWVSDSDEATFRAELPQRMKASDYEDWWIFNTLILGTDSQGKNSYHAWDPATGGPWRYIPWDLDASLGQNFDTTRTSPTSRVTFAEDNRIFARLLADPILAGPMRERYRKLLRAEVELGTVNALIDRLVQQTERAARRDWSKYEPQYRTFASDPSCAWCGWHAFPNWSKRTDWTTYDEEVAYVRQWVNARWKALEERLP